MPTTIEPEKLLTLLGWMSPAFPTAAFAYSHGLEWAIEDGAVRHASDLRDWITDLLTRGSGWNDAVLFARCWEDDTGALNELALSLATSRERHFETTQLGRAFGIASDIFLPQAPARRDGDVAYPIAVGVACKLMGIARSQALLAYLQASSNSLISVAVRLVPLGQTQGLAVMRDLIPVIADTARRAARATLDDLGSLCVASDIAAMRHETQASRVFRT